MILKGIKGLMQSRKGTLCLLILGSLVALTAKGLLDGICFAAVVTTIASLYMWTQHKTDMALGGNIHTEGRNE